jgi:hypothetical protein
VEGVEKRAYQVRLARPILFYFLAACLDMTLFFFFLSKCRKSMARIKYVINERRLAYEGALKIHAKKMKQAAKEGERGKGNSADVQHREREAQKVSPPVSEAAQTAVDSLPQHSAT